MPTDLARAVQHKQECDRIERADLCAAVLLIPLICCLASMLLCLLFPAFEAAVVLIGVLM
jgi:hypothetical protein